MGAIHSLTLSHLYYKVQTILFLIKIFHVNLNKIVVLSALNYIEVSLDTQEGMKSVLQLKVDNANVVQLDMYDT